MKSIFTSLICCAFGLGALSAAAQVPEFGDGLENLSPSRVLTNQTGRYDHFKGIGRIQSTNGRACTATLIDTRSSHASATAPAYVLTSGHCLYRKNNGVILVDHPVSGTMTFNYFSDTVGQQQPYPLKRVNWSSMQGVDLAVVELDVSLETLIQAGIQPLEMAEETPEAGTDILVVGAPLPFEAPYLRMAACTQQTSGEVIEYPWVWRHTVKNQCKDIDTGSSGSPVLTRDSNTLFAVINTTTLTGDGTPSGPILTSETNETDQGGNFGNPISYLRQCFVAGEFNRDPEVCPLFPTFSMEFSVTGHPEQYTKVKLDSDGSKIYPDWEVAFSIDKPFYRYKTVQQAIQCENPDYYSPAIESKEPMTGVRIGPQPGVQMLCILGVDSIDERPSTGLMRNALTLATELQPASPASPPQVQIIPRHDSYSVSWQHDSHLISSQTFKLGPVQSTDCNDPSGYSRALRAINVPSQMLPLKICTYAYDHADQPSDVREDVLAVRDVQPGTTAAKKPATKILRIEFD